MYALSVTLVFVMRVLTVEHLWMSTYEYITTISQLPTRMHAYQRFALSFQITTLPHINCFSPVNTKMTLFFMPLFAQPFHDFNCIVSKLL